MKMRGWSIRAKIMTLAVVPLLAITGLAIFGVAVTAGPALNLLEAHEYEGMVANPGERLMTELQKERRISVSFPPGAPALLEQRKVTDEMLRQFKESLRTANAPERFSPRHVQLIDSFSASLETLPQLRRDVDGGKTDPFGVVNRYSNLIDVAYQMFSPLTDLSNVELARLARGLYEMSRTRELTAREDAVVNAAVSDTKLTAQEYLRVVQAVGARRQQQDEAIGSLTSPHRENYENIFAGNSYTTLRAMEDSLGNSGVSGKVPIDLKVWRSSVDAVLTQMSQTESQAAKAASDLANSVGLEAFGRPIIAALVGLICAIAALTLALRTGRSVVRRLDRLRISALEVAHERLPAAIAALRLPGSVGNDPALDIPMVAVGSDEVGQVGHAFSAVQHTAVRAAMDEATLRRGLSEVFLNIARRSQALLHRQLTLLDRMERRTTQPQELEDLFRLDHMATRMRRHAEALVILAGSAPGRGWRHPVPLVDVVRGATSEIEDYVRVRLDPLPDVRILGRAVGDLIHLMAEILENATSFAPPHTQVRVHAEIIGRASAPSGLGLYIEDRGLGMSEVELAEANIRLADPPAFDPAHSARLGLLVVAKLAARQGIKVSLKPSSFGGITAVILVPGDLIFAGPADSVVPVTAPAQQREIAAPAPDNWVPDERTVDMSSAMSGGLPRRQRRNSVDNQPDEMTTVTLTDEAITVVATPAEPPTDDTARHRTADEVRSMMSAFQSGSVRGRAQAVTDPSENGTPRDPNSNH